MNKSLYALCALILIPAAAQATAISLNAGADISTKNLSSSTTFQCNGSQTTAGPTAAFDCGNPSLTPTTGTGSGEARATANWGSLSAYATLVAGEGPEFVQGARVKADASAYFDDFLQAFRPIAGVNTAFTGSFVVDATISGAISLGGSSGTALGNLQLTVGSQTCLQQLDGTSGSSMTCHIVVPFSAGANVELFLHLSATTDLFVPFGGSVRVTSDFSHTALINGITVLDANGNLVTDAVIQAASGTTYPGATADTNPSTVPEPGTVGLLGTGLALLAWKATRGRAL